MENCESIGLVATTANAATPITLSGHSGVELSLLRTVGWKNKHQTFTIVTRSAMLKYEILKQEYNNVTKSRATIIKEDSIEV